MIFVDRKGNLHDTMRYPEYCGCETCGICGLMNKGEEFARFLHLRTATLKYMSQAINRSDVDLISIKNPL
jgi:hypothetical protein